jgi:hypothetical protein
LEAFWDHPKMGDHIQKISKTKKGWGHGYQVQIPILPK